MKFKKNIYSNIILHILSISIGFFSSVLIARGLGPSNQGQFAFYVLIFNLIVSYGDFGIISATSYHMKRSNYKEEEVINNNISLLLILCVFYFILSLIFRNLIFSNSVLKLLMIWSVYFITSFISTCLMEIYTAYENVYVFNRYLIFIHVLKALLICPLFFMNHINVISVSIVYAILEVIKLCFLSGGLKLKYKFIVNLKLCKEELKYSIPLYLAALFIYLNYRVDQVMVKYYIGNAALGIYALSVTLAELAKMVPDSVISAFTGKLYNCKEEDEKRIVTLTIKMSFYMTILISVIGVFCKPLITILYGQEYSAAGLSMIILLIGIPFLSVGKVSSVYFYTHGKTKVHMVISFLVLILNLILNFLLLPKYGIYGAAFTSSLSYFMYALFYLITFSKEDISAKNIILINKDDFHMISVLFKDIKRKIFKINIKNSTVDVSKRMIFHIPNHIDLYGKSGSSLRPIKMITAFQKKGYVVDVVMGYGKERKRSIKQIIKNIKNGVKYDLLYSESSTMPTLLTEKHHLPIYPFLDFNFFKFCKRKNIKIGLFYRDIHWKFDLYTRNNSLKSKIAILFYKYDLFMYNKIINYMYIPSEKFKEYLSDVYKYNIVVLPPGCDLISDINSNNCNNQRLNIFYVGGLNKEIYDFDNLFKVVSKSDKLNLTVCCRQNEWNSVSNDYADLLSDNIHIVHDTSENLKKYYSEADVCSLIFKNNDYMDMALPVKMFEYMSYYKPIIATSGTEAGRFVKQFNIGYVIDYNEQKLSDLLTKICDDKSQLNEKIKNIEKIIGENLWENRASKVIKDLCGDE